jgi:hypothetical protein
MIAEITSPVPIANLFALLYGLALVKQGYEPERAAEHTRQVPAPI